MSRNKQQYTTLATGVAQSDSLYHDRDSLPFEASYPLIKFTDEFIDINDKNELIEKYLLNNFWYQKSNSSKREDILKRVLHVNKNLQIVLDFIENKYGRLGMKCLHISIAGSYIYSDTPGDIDLNVVVDGSFFDYSYFNEGF